MIEMELFKKKKEKKIENIQFPDHIETLDDKNFEDFINSYPTCLIDFWAPWCQPCRTMGPRLRKLSTLYKDKIAFGKLNIQEYKKIADKYKIISIPTLIIFKDGKQKSAMYGVKSVGDIKKIIEKYV